MRRRVDRDEAADGHPIGLSARRTPVREFTLWREFLATARTGDVEDRRRAPSGPCGRFHTTNVPPSAVPPPAARGPSALGTPTWRATAAGSSVQWRHLPRRPHTPPQTQRVAADVCARSYPLTRRPSPRALTGRSTRERPRFSRTRNPSLRYPRSTPSWPRDVSIADAPWLQRLHRRDDLARATRLQSSRPGHHRRVGDANPTVPVAMLGRSVMRPEIT
jgi:hypothetical protein